MAYYQPEEIQKAKEMDLFTYLQNYEPDELVHFSRGTYMTRTHDSLKISNGMWYWFSRGIGGKTALEYLIQVRDYSFIQAVETILGYSNNRPPTEYQQPKKVQNIRLILPKKSNTTDKVISLSKIDLDQNMFKYTSKDIINNIKEDAYIEDVKVKRKFPDTFEITIKERKASFIVKVDNTYACINNQGYILEILESKNNLPVIVGAKTNLEQLFVGNRLLEIDLKRLNDVLKIMESATSNNLSEYISQIDITDKEDYIITMQNKNKNIHLGDVSNLSTKMLWIIKFIEIEGNTAGEIMLNMNLNDEKNKPYFRVSI